MIANKGLLYFVYIIRGWIIWWPVSDSLRPAHFFSEINDDYNPLYKYPFLLTYLLTYRTYLHKRFYLFLPARCYANVSRVFARATCLSHCPSVCH